jgi:hypothetical protein
MKWRYGIAAAGIRDGYLRRLSAPHGAWLQHYRGHQQYGEENLFHK